MTALAMRCFGALLLALSLPARAASGDLDLALSGDGKLTTAFTGFAFANAIAVQPNGRIVVAGGGNGNFAFARYLSDGTLDTSFSDDGATIIDLGGQGAAATSLALMADGRIVAAGFGGPSLDRDVAVVRLNADGSRDTSFSGDGRIRFEFDSQGAGGGATGVALQADGKVVVVGSTGSDFALARLNADGSFDGFFGSPGGGGTGIVIRNAGSAADAARAVLVEPAGTILVAGSTSRGGDPRFEDVGDFVLERFDAQGVPFNIAAAGTTRDLTGPGIDVPRAMALQPDGRIIVAGDLQVTGGLSPGGASRGMQVVRYNADGSLDTSFAGDGLAAIGFGQPAQARAVAVQVDGKIVVAGFVEDGNAPKFALTRLRSDGSLDTTFGEGGFVITDFAGTARDFGAAMAIQPGNGRLVVAGSAELRDAAGTLTDQHFALARYHAITCFNRDVTILGTNGDDTLTGRSILRGGGTIEFDDVIHGMGGNDTINGRGGNDTICGASGADTINGGAGDDTIDAGTGGDTVDAGDGTDFCSNFPQVGVTESFTSCETLSTFSGLSGAWREVYAACNAAEPRPQCMLWGSIDVSNPGRDSTAAGARIAFYLSADDLLDEGDRFVAHAEVDSLAPGAVQTVRLRGRVAGLAGASGLRVIAVLDDTDVIAEANESNNIVPSVPLP